MPHVPLYATEKFAGTSRNGLYGDVVETIDWSAGQIVKTLADEGLADNTIVIFTSDNGPWMEMPPRMFGGGQIKPWDAGSAGLLHGSKGSTYEGGIRVPCIVRWPKRIPAGRVSPEMASTMDLYTTLIALATARVPDDRTVDGLDITAMLTGQGPSPRKRFYYFGGGARQPEAVREGPWKLRLWRPKKSDAPPTPELFHLERDPAERFNLAEDRPEIVERLTRNLDDFAKKMVVGRQPPPKQ